MKLEDIKAKAQKVMQEHKVKSVYATSDGQIFLPNKKQAAEFHATRKKLKVFEIKEEPKGKKKSAENGAKTGDDKNKSTQNSTNSGDDKKKSAESGTKPDGDQTKSGNSQNKNTK